ANSSAIAIFPAMVVGVAAVGVLLTAAFCGRRGLRSLFRRMLRWKVSWYWYIAALLIPPACVLLVLKSLQLAVSPAFAPNLFPVGLAIGIAAGFFEEIGWSGYAYPRMVRQFGPLVGAIVLGILWGIWHLPVVDSLGAATPHGSSWPEFFFAFVFLVSGL